MADKHNYASYDCLDQDEILGKLADFQKDADVQGGKVDQLKAKLAKAKKEHQRLMEKVADIGRAQEHGEELYELKGGELITEAPDLKGHLDLKDDPGEEHISRTYIAEEEDIPDDAEEEVLEEEDVTDLDVVVDL